MDWSRPASLGQFSVSTFSDKEKSAEENHGWSTGIIVTALTDLTEHSRTGDTGNRWRVSDVMHDRNHGQRQSRQVTQVCPLLADMAYELKTQRGLNQNQRSKHELAHRSIK